MLGITVLFTNNFARHKDTNPHFTVKEIDNSKKKKKNEQQQQKNPQNKTKLRRVLSLKWLQIR